MTQRARLVAFGLIVAFQFGGPFYRQVLHGQNPIFKNWVMYRGVGTGLVEVTFFQRDTPQRDTPVDRFAVLGFERRTAPETLFRIAGAKGFARVTRQLCERLGPNADLRAHAREATAHGWRPLARGHDNLCAPHDPEIS